MNVRQLHTGIVDLGYFFLLAFISGLLGYILMRTVEPVETFWKEWRDEYCSRHGNRIPREEVTKTMIIRDWLSRRTVPPTNIHV